MNGTIYAICELDDNLSCDPIAWTGDKTMAENEAARLNRLSFVDRQITLLKANKTKLGQAITAANPDHWTKYVVTELPNIAA